jgi:predicted phosphohydrolase
MAVFVMSDLHLSTNQWTDKSMEVFGTRWHSYMVRIKNNWNRLVAPEDTVVVNGDISWAMTLEEARSDFDFLNSLTGTKIISKGNHDFWWSTVSKINSFFEQNKFDTIKILHNNAHLVEGFVICGSRGWYNDDKIASMPQNADYQKIVSREATRLRASLSEASMLECDGHERLVFLHFPPVWGDFVCREILDVLHEFGVTRCFFGHIHGLYEIPASFIYENIKFTMTSADFLNFTPLFIKN